MPHPEIAIDEVPSKRELRATYEHIICGDLATHCVRILYFVPV
jgi:hypothetical protein